MKSSLNLFLTSILCFALFTPIALQGQDSTKSLEQRIVQLERELQELQDVEAVKKLMRAYGYYLDKGLWDQVVDTFSDDAQVEISGRGVFNGRERIEDLFIGAMGGGKIGLGEGRINNHIILQGIVNIDPEGTTAKGRWRTYTLIAQYQVNALWGEGIYENEYVKEGDTWRISKMHYYGTYFTPYDEGPELTALPLNNLNEEFPPDELPTVDYDVYPGFYIPPFHYANPGSGRPWTIEDSERYSTSGINSVIHGLAAESE
jgi:hypothetical protein